MTAETRRVRTEPLYLEAGEIGCGHINPDTDPAFEGLSQSLFAKAMQAYENTHAAGEDGDICLASPAGTGIASWSRWQGHGEWALQETIIPPLVPVDITIEEAQR